MAIASSRGRRPPEAAERTAARLIGRWFAILAVPAAVGASGCGSEQAPAWRDIRAGSTQEILDGLVSSPEGTDALIAMSELYERGAAAIPAARAMLPRVHGRARAHLLELLIRHRDLANVSSEVLLASLRDESAKTRAGAIHYLIFIDERSEATLEALRARLVDPDSYVRYMAVEGLRRAGTGEVRKLLTVLADEAASMETRKSVAWALASGDGMAAALESTDLMAALQSLLSAARDRDWRTILKMSIDVLEVEMAKLQKR